MHHGFLHVLHNESIAAASLAAPLYRFLARTTKPLVSALATRRWPHWSTLAPTMRVVSARAFRPCASCLCAIVLACGMLTLSHALAVDAIGSRHANGEPPLQEQGPPVPGVRIAYAEAEGYKGQEGQARVGQRSRA